MEQRRQNEIEINRKNNTIKQLINVIDEDIEQIEGFIYLQNFSLISCNLIFDNLNNKNQMSEDSIIFHLSSVGRALRSFFPQEGIFNQLVNSDLIKMINSDKLKTNLFKLYNEDLKRHEVHTKEFDKFFLDYNYRLSENFYLQDTWSTSPIDENPIIISGYRFNESYYKSSKIFAILIIILLCFISAVSLGEFCFYLKSNNPNYLFFFASVISFCIGSALFWIQLRKSN